jgi:membrane-bound ClpP family serine protease
VPGAVLVAFGLAGLVVGEGAAKAAGVLAVIGIILAVRGYQLAVETHNDSVTVCGMLRTRVIPRTAITQITDYPAIVWTDRAGKKRWTPVLAFLTPPGHCLASPSTTPIA